MKRIYRLKKNYQFNYIYRKGKAVGNSLMTVHYASNGNGKLKIGFSIPKKFGKAVRRNLVKRRLKHAFSLILPEVDKNFNYIITPKPAADPASYEDLSNSLSALLYKCGALKGDRK